MLRGIPEPEKFPQGKGGGKKFPVFIFGNGVGDGLRNSRLVPENVSLGESPPLLTSLPNYKKFQLGTQTLDLCSIESIESIEFKPLTVA